MRLIASFLFTSITGLSLSQSAATGDKSVTTDKTVTLTQTVEPSFHIEPIVHRFQGRRGEVIPFSFEIASTGKSMDVMVAPINLQQEESGIILHDESSTPPKHIRFTSETQFKLAPGESKRIEGEVTIPLAKSNFLSFGVLVKDRGQLTAKENDVLNPQKTTAAVRFVTQYVLRIDIDTGVQEVGEMKKLVLETGTVRSVSGMPVTRVFLFNPTDFSVECWANATIGSNAPSQATSKAKPFHLGLPSRKDLLGDERYLVRVMPHSRVRLEAQVDALLSPGSQSIHVSLTNGRRQFVEQSFEINVQPGDFPALETQLAYVTEEISVQPAQIEIGRMSSNRRSCNLRFTNNSDETRNLKLALRDLQGGELAGIKLSDNTFEIKPGRTKTIRASLESDNSETSPQYGHVEIQLVDTTHNNQVKHLPLSLLYSTPESSKLEYGELQSLEQDGHTSFQLQVTNRGVGFVPIDGRLQVASGNARALELADGYGAWLASGETRMLKFIPELPLAVGDYQLSLTVNSRDGEPAYTKTLVVPIAPNQSKAL